jgi:hypothetical protein
MQEAADATAYSGAVLHARGMNLIVMINLIMAMVLAIRVALKVLQIVLGIVTVAVDACALLIFSPTAEVCIFAAPFLHEADSAIENLIKITRDPINEILKALHGVEVALSKAIPLATVAGASEVAMKYKPPIIFPPVAIPPSLTQLPLTNGTTDRLCGEAAIAVGEMVAELVNLFVPGVGSIAGWISGPLASIAKSSPGYFCELGGAGGPPDVSGLINDNANSKCDSDLQLKQHNLDEANRLWRAECSKFGVTCIDSVFDEFGNKMQSTMPDIDDVRLPPKQTPIPAADKAHLRQLQHDRDVAEQDLDSFSKRQCVDNTKKDLQKKLSQMPPPKQGNGQDMEPMKVDPKWQNGDTLGQVLGLVRSDGTILNWGPKGVKVGAWKDRRTRAPIRPPEEAYFAYAQAEFFYDCAGAWKDNQCNGGESPLHDNEEAMWHFRWRARLRRYNAPVGVFDGPIELVLGFTAADMVTKVAGGSLPRGVDGKVQNLALRRELLGGPGSFKLH